MDKKHGRPPLRILVKYFLLQLPGWLRLRLILILLRHWMEFPVYLAWVLLGIWVGKDIILFPILWRFYDPSQHPDRFRMIGRKGIAVTRLSPDGYVSVGNDGRRPFDGCPRSGRATRFAWRRSTVSN